MQPRFSGFLIGLIILGIAEVGCPQANGGEKSDAKVKVKLSATKPDGAGKQMATLTLDIEKGWYLHANPVNNEDLGYETTVKVHSKGKLVAKVKYPAGKPRVELRVRFDIYEGRVEIPIEIQRAVGDNNPVSIDLYVRAFDKGSCLAPAVIKLSVR